MAAGATVRKITANPAQCESLNRMSSHIALPPRCVQTYQHKNNDQRCEIKAGVRGRIDWLRQYIEALLVDEQLADQVWEACHSAEINEICM